nr:hypothetical protein CFP56_41223 [Quercus suber]
MTLKDLKLSVQLCNHIPYVTKFMFIPNSQSITVASMTVGDWSTIRLVETFMAFFLDNIDTSWVLKPHGFKTKERSGSWLSKSRGLYPDGGSVSRWAVVCFEISGSVSDMGGAGIGTIGVVGAMGFVAAEVSSTVGDGVGRGGHGGPLGCLDCGVGLSVAILGCRRVFMGVHNHVPYCCSSVHKVLPLSDERWLGDIKLDSYSQVASSTDSSPIGLYKPRRYLSKVQGPCTISFCGSVSSSKIMSTVLEPKSRTSKNRIERHILRKVLVRTSRLTLLLVKSFTTRMWLWLSTIGGRSTVLLYFALRDKRAH